MAHKERWAAEVVKAEAAFNEAVKRHEAADKYQERMELVGSVKQQSAAQQQEEAAYRKQDEAERRLERAKSLPYFWETVERFLSGKLAVPALGKTAQGICFLHPGQENPCTALCETDAFLHECPGCMKSQGSHSLMLTLLPGGRVQHEPLMDSHPRFHTREPGELFTTDDGNKAFVITYPCAHCTTHIRVAPLIPPH